MSHTNLPDGRRLILPSDDEERAISKHIDQDDAPEWSDSDVAEAQSFDESPLPDAFKRQVRRGRPPKSNPKRAVSIRFSAEVLDHFRSGGAGWQTAIDDALKQWIAEHGH